MTWRDPKEQGLLLASMVPGAVFYLGLFVDLFPLIEFRDWIAWDISWGAVKRVLANMVLRNEGVFSRHVSLLYVNAAANLCGANLPCLNSLVMLPTILSAGLGTMLARQCGLSRFVSWSAVQFWFFSIPVFDAMTWQATIHDRLALMFALLALVVFHAVVRKDFLGSKGASTIRILLANMAILVPTMLAYNSKESAWFLGPALALLSFKHKRVFWIVGPAIYAVYHNIRYLISFHQDQNWSQHVLEPWVSTNASYYLATSFGIQVEHAFLGAGVLVVLIIALFVRDRQRKQDDNDAATLFGRIGVPLLVWLVAFVIPMRTKYQAPYYLYAPQFLFSLLLASFLQSFAPQRQLWSVIVPAVCLAVHLLNFGAHLPEQKHWYRIECSRNFTESFNAVRTALGPLPNNDTVFVRPPAAYYADDFLCGDSLRSLLRLLYPPDALSAVGDEPVRFTTDLDEPARSSSTVFLVYDEAMRLTSAWRGGQRLP